MRQRIIPFYTMDAVMGYADLVLVYADASVLFVMPNAIVIQYNGQVILLIAREYQGD